jgi:hypothetical protein
MRKAEAEVRYHYYNDFGVFTFATMSNFLRRESFLKSAGPMSITPEIFTCAGQSPAIGAESALMAEDSRVSLQRILYRQMPCRDALYDEVLFFQFPRFQTNPL